MSNVTRNNGQTAVFIYRTMQVIKQYNNYKDKISETDINYCNTLFLNACFSLLSICKEAMTIRKKPFESRFPNEIVSEDQWGISPDNIERVKGNGKNVPNIVKGIRDCLDHNKFTFNNDGYGMCAPIEWIEFDSEEFKAKFKFNDFKHFVNKIAKFTEGQLTGRRSQ